VRRYTGEAGGPGKNTGYKHGIYLPDASRSAPDDSGKCPKCGMALEPVMPRPARRSYGVRLPHASADCARCAGKLPNLRMTLEPRAIFGGEAGRS